MTTVNSQGLECCRSARDMQGRCLVQMGPAATLSQHLARLADWRTKEHWGSQMLEKWDAGQLWGAKAACWRYTPRRRRTSTVWASSCIIGTSLYSMLSYLLTIKVLGILILVNMWGVLLSLKHAIQQISAEFRLLIGAVLPVLSEGYGTPRPDLPGHRSKTWSPSGQKLKRLRSRPGPKSWGRCVLWTRLAEWLVVLLLCETITPAKAMHTATDARVGLPIHLGGLGALTTGKERQHIGAKRGERRHRRDPNKPDPPRVIIRKRALRRAVNRAQKAPDLSTWYRGRRTHVQQLRQGQRVAAGDCCAAAGRHPDRSAPWNPRAHRRLRIVTWSTGGLTGTRYGEILEWLRAEEIAGRTVDLCLLQETAWRDDQEFHTTPIVPEAGCYHAIHCAGKEKAGILCLVRQGLVPSSGIRTVAKHPGRLLHVRLMFDTPLDVLCVYQFAWNPHKTTLQGDKTQALLRQRQRIWTGIDQWLRSIPQRNGCILAGDLNTPLVTEPGVCGQGIMSRDSIAQQDQAELQTILRIHHCCALNTWRGAGTAARTYLPPTPAMGQQGTQIDFIVARGHMIDDVSRRAGAFSADFVPVTGCRHRPVQATIATPRRPRSRELPVTQISARQARKQLREPESRRWYQASTQGVLDHNCPDADLDSALIAGWRRSLGSPIGEQRRPADTQAQEALGQQAVTIRDSIRGLWNLRAQQRRLRDRHAEGDAGPTVQQIWQSWAVAAKIQAHNRQLKRECRRRKTLRIIEAVQANNVYGAAQQFAPKQVRRRLQLRTSEGQLQTHEAEYRQIVDFYRKLFQGTATTPVRLSQDIYIDTEEVNNALRRLQAAKAMPSTSAPAILWKLMASQVAQILTDQFNGALRRGCESLPLRWCISELVLLPKAGKLMTSPSQLRPINLLPTQAKVLGAILAARIQVHAAKYLAGFPQFAYTEGRALGQALERVAGHCAAVRHMLKLQAPDLHSKRERGTVKQMCGGCVLSLDITAAYDSVPWGDLVTALREAGVPQNLIDPVLLVHQQAKLKISHGGQQTLLSLGRGLRQGCGLAPVLWAVYSCWVLKWMDTELVQVSTTNTTYADDLLFAWKLHSGRDLENAYAAMRHILRCLKHRGLQVSVAKTVILLELLGPGAEHHLHRIRVTHPTEEGLFVKFLIAGEAVYVKIVKQHVYLGVCISYGKFEQDTYRRRADLARSAFTRLAPVLKCRNVSLKLRLLLWQGTVLPTLLHGLDTMGLPLKEAQQLKVLYYKHARSLANSYSMFTHESNAQLANRLRLTDPITRLIKAVERRAATDNSMHPDLRPGAEQLRWRSSLRDSLLEARGALGASAGHGSESYSLQPTPHLTIGQFVCDDCGISYATAAALKRHRFRSHMTEDEQVAVILENKRNLRQEVMHYAKAGMPHCRLCDKKFTTWHAFFYHVNTKGCQQLRDRREGQMAPDLQAPSSEALVDSPDILTLTRHCTWRDIALHPRNKQSLNHCPECHQWAVKPSYVRRHMLARHKDLGALIERSQDLIHSSDLGLQNPCQFCGSSYQRKSAHLRACAGVFNGVFVFLRVARGRELLDLGHDGHGGGGGSVGLLRDRHPGAHADQAARATGQRHSGAAQGRELGPQTGAGGDGVSTEVSKRGAQGPTPRPRQRPRQGKRTQQGQSQGPGVLHQLLGRSSKTTGWSGMGQEVGTTQPGPLGGHGAGPRQPGGLPNSGEPHGHSGAEARNTEPHPQAGHGLCPPSQDGCGEQPGGFHLPGRSKVARAEAAQPREAQDANEGDTVPASTPRGQGQVRKDGGFPLLKIDGGGVGLDDDGRDGHQCPKMGCGSQETCEGHHHSADQDQPGAGGPEGDGCGVRGARGSGEIPCDTQAGGAVQIPHANHAPGDWPSHGRGQPDVEAAGPAGKVWRVGGLGSVPSPREHEPQWLGAAVGCCDRAVTLRLGNRANYCYANATVKCMLHAAMQCGGPATAFGDGLLAFIEGISASRGITHLWSSPFWRAAMRDWAAPAQQHDGAEFIQHLVEHQLLRDTLLVVHWQARMQRGDAYQGVDRGSSAPLLLVPTEHALANPGFCTSVQRLIDEWHEQEHVHAAIAGPPVLVLQAGRFACAHHGAAARAVKCRFQIGAERDIMFPVFDGALSVQHMRYRLNSVLVHWGENPDAGHYTALLYSYSDSAIYHADDNQPGKRISEEAAEKMSRDSYIFIYTREV